MTIPNKITEQMSFDATKLSEQSSIKANPNQEMNVVHIANALRSAYTTAYMNLVSQEQKHENSFDSPSDCKLLNPFK